MSPMFRSSILSIFVLLPLSIAAGQEKEPAVERLHGIIDKDQQWSGHVLITDDLTIQGAKVTIAAGTIVEFAQKEPNHNPTLMVGSVDRPGGELELLGTADKPVVFRTMSGTNPGRVVVNVRSRVVPAEKPGQEGSKAPAAARLPNDITWQNVRFEELGHITTRREGRKEAHIPEPAVTFYVVGAPHAVTVADCTFDNCTRLVVRTGDGARITMTGNRFTHPRDRASLEVFGREGGAPAGTVAVARNTAGASLTVRGTAALMMENIVVGLDAALVAIEDSSEATKISGNYVHNTTEEDDGRYGLNCENPAALIEDNIIRGGSVCVWNGSRRMSGNVLIASPKLSSKVVKVARTHQLVQALPAGATFERNVLIGPAYSLLMPQPAQAERPGDKTVEPIAIRQNVFDGFAESNRAVHINSPGRPSVPITLFNNVFLRVPTLVYSELKGGPGLTWADYNAIAPPAERAYEQVGIAELKLGEPGWGAKDVQVAEVANLRLSAVPPEPLPDYDADVASGKTSISSLRQRLMSYYRPQPDSSLLRAGRPDKNAVAAGTPPPIGLPPE